MPDLSNISVKERNAEYFHESFERFYRSGEYSEACQSLWKALNLIIAGIASFENKDIKTVTEAKLYLQKFVQNGEITASELSSLEFVYASRLRDSGDDTMLAIQIERSENLFRKLKKILKDYVMNGPPKEPTKSALGEDNDSVQGEDQSYGSFDNTQHGQNQNEGN
jgi:hypothetical protein